VLVTQFDTTGADRGLNGFTIWAAQSPATNQYANDAKGTEFFLSSNAAEEATGTTVNSSNSIVAWAMTNTRSLDSNSPSLTLSNTRLGVTDVLGAAQGEPEGGIRTTGGLPQRRPVLDVPAGRARPVRTRGRVPPGQQ
jgi:hypothetical protein